MSPRFNELGLQTSHCMKGSAVVVRIVKLNLEEPKSINI